ncbi:MAG: hypothetical protein KDD36_08790 [Flavobacteriales bacterium]|nr:hypothetical protein [Flavobacteriales bacterium]
MRKHLLLFFLFVCCLPLAGSSQTVLLDIDVAGDTVPPTKGKNLKHFVHMYMSYGFIGGIMETGARIRPESSSFYEFGFRYKRKISPTIATGLELAYRNDVYNLRQEKGKVIPDTVLHNREKLSFHILNLGWYMRVNYGKRGNSIGHFVDAGTYSDVNVHFTHFTQDKYPDGRIVKTTTQGLGIEELLSFGLVGRWGFGNLVITGRYRLTDALKPSTGLPDLPKGQLGLQLGFH